MSATRQLHALGQSLWLDNITRDLLDRGTLAHYIEQLSITGLTSNPSIFNEAIAHTSAYDESIHTNTALSGEALFIKLALEDLRRAADLLHAIFIASDGVDGWVSMEVSPLLANDTHGTIEAAAAIHKLADRPNLFVKIPGTPAGIPAIEESIFAGIPINVTLLFSPAQYLAAAAAYGRAIERRLAAGRHPRIASVASLFVSRWDKAVNTTVPPELQNKLGIAIGRQTYHAYRQLLGSEHWGQLAARGARPQRLLWASTGTKDPAASTTLYIEALAAPDTINTIPEKTLRNFADHGQVHGVLATDGADAAATLLRFKQAGVDIDALAEKLQSDGTRSFVESWRQLLERVAAKRAPLPEPCGQRN